MANDPDQYVRDRAEELIGMSYEQWEIIYNENDWSEYE